MSRLRSVLVIAPLLPACALVTKLQGGEGGGGGGAPGTLAGRDCEAFGGELPAIDAPREQLITAMACQAEHDTPLSPEDRHYVRWHAGFDDRRFDPVLASMIVVNCASGRTCKFPYVAGQMAYYAQATPEAVAAGIAGMALGDDVKRAWVERYRAARDQVVATLEGMDEEDVVLLREVPEQVRAERAAYYKALGDDLDAFEQLRPELVAALEAKRGDRALIERAVALRDRHVRRCVAETTFSTSLCWHGTTARPLTLALAWLGVYADDAMLAYIESETLTTGLDVVGAAAHISVAQERARDIGQRYSWEPWSRLDGLKEDRHKQLHATVRELGDKRLDWAGESLKSVTARGGGLAAINYEVRVSGSTGYECSKNITLRQDDDGSVRGYRKCRVSSHSTQRHVTKPVIVPAPDAKGLEKGNFVFTVLDPKTRKGRVVHARPTGYSQQDDLSRIRFTPLKPKLDAKDRDAIARIGSQ